LDANGTEVSNGTAQAGGNRLSISGEGAYDGTLRLLLSDDPPTYYIPGFSTNYTFESEPVQQVNETNTTDEVDEPDEPTLPDATLPATVDCDTATYEWDSNATDVVITCTVTNPNPFDATVGFSWKVIPGTPPPVELVWNEAAGPSVTVDANGNVDLTFSLVRNAPTDGMFPGLQGEGYVVVLTCLDSGDGACDAMTEPQATTEGEIVWTLGEMPVEVVEPAPAADDASSAMTPVLVGIGLVIAIVAGLLGVLYLRNREDDDLEFDDEDEEDYYEQAMAAPENTGRPKSVDLGASKSLEELKESGKSLHSDAPEGLASSPSLGSSADAFEFGATGEAEAVEAEEET
ncbi:MAG: hypothetical protein VX052_03875, partial [Candidatus Thermoplasmatota archaeon]|nr:hypothetical protein [Candidatus Thermoplasmatota archaeon]